MYPDFSHSTNTKLHPDRAGKMRRSHLAHKSSEFTSLLRGNTEWPTSTRLMRESMATALILNEIEAPRKRGNEITVGSLSEKGNGRLTGAQWHNHFTASNTLACESRHISNVSKGNLSAPKVHLS